MSKKLYEESNISDIASAIREKNGSQNTYTVSQMGNAVRAIHTDPVLESLSVTENGNYLPSAGKDGFSSVSVDVAGGGGSGAVVQPLSVSENGTYNPPSGVDGYAPVTVNVSGGGSGNTILHETEYQTSGSFSYSKEITIPKTSNYKITVQTYSNGFSLKINGVAQQYTVAEVGYYAYLYYSELSLTAGDVITLSCTSSGRSLATFVITDMNGAGGGSTEPALPSEYQRVEYLDFTPSVGILITIPTTATLYEADFSSDAISSSQESTVFGYRGQYSTDYDFEAYIGGDHTAKFWFRTTYVGGTLSSLQNYVTGTRIKLIALMSARGDRSTALIGRYANYNAENQSALDGKFYSLKGYGPDNLTNCWFVPCYRKSDNQVGVYDHIAQAFYSETYAVGSGYSIVAGPDVT